MVFVMSFGANRMSTGTIQAFFWAFTVVMGLSHVGDPAHLYRHLDRATFFATAAAFVVAEPVGLHDQADLSASAPS